MKILIVGNCNGQVIERLLIAGADVTAERHVIHSVAADIFTPDYLARFDLVFAQDVRPDRTDLWAAIGRHKRIVRFPPLLFFGLTPDHSTLKSPVTDMIPRIMSCAWMRGFDPDRTRALFNPEFVAAMGYLADYPAQKTQFISRLAAYTDRAEALFDRWHERGNFFFTGNHPRSFVVEDVLHDILERQDTGLRLRRAADLIPDPLQIHGVLPNLNHPRLTNLLSSPDHFYMLGQRILSLEDMIAWIFSKLQDIPDPVIDPANLARFDAAHAAWTGRTPEPMTNPYAKRPPAAFWSRMVARPAAAAVTPGDGLRPVIAPHTRVATAGSCFAQHVARAMVQDGLTYYVAEPAPAGMDAATAEARGYGLFSARCGNIYSTRQLLQLIRRAYGRFTPIETAWPVEGGFVDPFRPNIGEVFATAAAVEAARAEHLAKVRQMFETLDVLVFTLGLTEGWFDRRDGAAFPVTPGAVTKGGDPAHFGFQNLDTAAVKGDLLDFLAELARVNPKAEVILTVSPVPLIATYGPDDVLSATTWSKSVLRAVAGEVAALSARVQYFPSYEIITGSFSHGAYFAEDLRSVRPEGVAHVMRVFRERLVIGAGGAAVMAKPAIVDTAARADLGQEIARQMHVSCDEELLVRDV